MIRFGFEELNLSESYKFFVLNMWKCFCIGRILVGVFKYLEK